MLYIVSTPIGNLKDITYRAVEVLKDVDLIAAEDTRHTKTLCNHYDIKTPLTSYFEHNEFSRGKELIDKLFYCYERMHREAYYRSQAHYFLYKGEKEKALVNTKKAIECNDILDIKTKKRFLEYDADELDYQGIGLL